MIIQRANIAVFGVIHLQVVGDLFSVFIIGNVSAVTVSNVVNHIITFISFRLPLKMISCGTKLDGVIIDLAAYPP